MSLWKQMLHSVMLCNPAQLESLTHPRNTGKSLYSNYLPTQQQATAQQLYTSVLHFIIYKRQFYKEKDLFHRIDSTQNLTTNILNGNYVEIVFREYLKELQTAKFFQLPMSRHLNSMTHFSLSNVKFLLSSLLL